MSNNHAGNGHSQTSIKNEIRAKERHLCALIGIQIRKARQQRKSRMEKTADMIGVSYQQLQKYESGLNRISAGRLLLLSFNLGIPIKYFFKTAVAYLIREK